MGLVHKGKSACKKLKRWFIANCLLPSSCCVDAACAIAEGAPLPPQTSHISQALPVLPQRMRSHWVCLVLCNAGTLYLSSQQTLPSQSVDAGDALPVKPQAGASPPQERCRWGDARGRKNLSVSPWVSNWVKRSLIIRSDSSTCQFLLFFSKTMTGVVLLFPRWAPDKVFLLRVC